MKEINNFWVDESNNRWDSNVYTEDQAKKYSQTMINCQDCQDCWNCRDCQSCQDCRSCRSCQDCQDCQDCWNCWNCRDCQSCQDCQDWKSNPQRIVSGKIGSRGDQTTVYFDSVRTAVVCGCFRGTLEEFANAVYVKHGNRIFGAQYKEFIVRVTQYIKGGQNNESE